MPYSASKATISRGERVFSGASDSGPHANGFADRCRRIAPSRRNPESSSSCIPCCTDRHFILHAVRNEVSLSVQVSRCAAGELTRLSVAVVAPSTFGLEPALSHGLLNARDSGPETFIATWIAAFRSAHCFARDQFPANGSTSGKNDVRFAEECMRPHICFE